MAALAQQQVSIAGVALTFVAAAGGGDTVPTGEHTTILVRNSGASTRTVTVDVPGNTRYGQPNPDVAVSVPAGATVAIGPLPTDLQNASDGAVHLTYSSATDLTLAVINN